MRLDIIGDVHGYADALEALLAKLGYADVNGAWRPPDARRAVFVGDLIDRGPGQLATVAIVRRMVEAGTALVVMGNHEFNAVAFATRDPDRDGDHFRQRRGANIDHHQVFLDAVGAADTDLHRDLVGFFRTIPLWLDLSAARIVHACWSPTAIATLGTWVDGDRRLREAGWIAAMTKGTAAHAACEVLLKGPEISLPPGVWYRDAQGSKRRTTRTRWWDAAATTIRAACVETSIAAQLPDDALPSDAVIPLDAGPPVFFGHYWMRGRPHLLAPERTCLDFSIAKGGVLCAYRFDGEPVLDPSRLVWVG